MIHCDAYCNSGIDTSPARHRLAFLPLSSAGLGPGAGFTLTLLCLINASEGRRYLVEYASVDWGLWLPAEEPPLRSALLVLGITRYLRSVYFIRHAQDINRRWKGQGQLQCCPHLSCRANRMAIG